MEKSRLDGSFTRADHRDKGGGYSISGSAALIIYHSRSLGKKKQPTIDCTHWRKWAEAEQTPAAPTPSHPSHVLCCGRQTVQNIKQNKHTTEFPSFSCANVAITVVITHLSRQCNSQYEQGDTVRILLITGIDSSRV